MASVLALRSTRHRGAMSRGMEGIPAPGGPRTPARSKKILLPRKTKAWRYEQGLTPCAVVLLGESPRQNGGAWQQGASAPLRSPHGEARRSGRCRSSRRRRQVVAAEQSRLTRFSMTRCLAHVTAGLRMAGQDAVADTQPWCLNRRSWPHESDDSREGGRQIADTENTVLTSRYGKVRSILSVRALLDTLG